MATKTRMAALGDGILEALATIRTRPLRALLAGFAMAAAVATTAIVQTALDGVARSAREASERAFGSDSFVVARFASGNLSRRELARKLERNPEITRADVRFLEEVASGRVIYAATAQRPGDVVAGGRRFENAAINGTQAALFEIRDVGVEIGRPFTRAEEERAAQVVVIGRAVADELFPVGDPLGATVRVGNRGFTVVGVQSQQGTAGGTSLDRYVWMPLAAFERTFGASSGLQVFAKAPGAGSTSRAEDRAHASMRARRHLVPGAADTFDLITPEASRAFVATLTERLGAAGPPISLMALLAAIIVVANTTLVSVTERTREIGIRRALGATRVSILYETVVESTLVAVAGGIAGVMVALAVLSVGSRVVDVPLPLEWPTVVGSLAAAGLSGLAAGWYPARRAARLDVIGALRQE